MTMLYCDTFIIQEIYDITQCFDIIFFTIVQKLVAFSDHVGVKVNSTYQVNLTDNWFALWTDFHEVLKNGLTMKANMKYLVN